MGNEGCRECLEWFPALALLQDLFVAATFDFYASSLFTYFILKTQPTGDRAACNIEKRKKEIKKIMKES